jgi:hypothetical protein
MQKTLIAKLCTMVGGEEGECDFILKFFASPEPLTLRRP